MSEQDQHTPVDGSLQQVHPERREFLRKLLVGTAATAALPLMSTMSLASDDEVASPDGTGKGGRGKGKGGRGKGKGGRGKGKGKGGRGKGKGGRGKGKGKGEGNE